MFASFKHIFLFSFFSFYQVLLNKLTDSPCEALPPPENIAQAANRLRKILRPSDPKDLEFVLDSQAIPQDFLRADIKV